MRITGSGNVGIGTTDTRNKLMIVGGNSLPSNSENPEASILVRNGGNNWLGIGNSNSGNWIQSSQPGIAGPAFNLLLNPLGGNVGIGTVSPGLYQGIQSKFEVSNSSGHGMINVNSASGSVS